MNTVYKHFIKKKIVYPLRVASASDTLHLRFHRHKDESGPYNILLKDVRPKEDIEGYHFIIHDTYVIPSKSSYNFNSIMGKFTRYLIDPQVIGFEESIRDVDQDE